MVLAVDPSDLFFQPPQPIFGDPISIYAYATARTADAAGYIQSLSNLSLSLAPPNINPVFPSGAAAPAVATSSPPPLTPIVWTAPAVPAPFNGTLDIGDLFPEPFDDDPPALVFPAAPAGFTVPVPDAPGVNLTYTYPDLNVSLPAPPDLLSLSISQFGGLTMPTIDETVPVLNAIAPSVIPYTPGDMYTSDLLQAAQASLQDRIENGGTGLPAAVETNIWNRAREREYKQQRDALADLDRMESLGYSFPPGVYLDARIKIQTETNYTIAGLSRDIAIEQAKLEQSNILAALDQAVKLEGQLINYTNAVEQRVFESTKYATEAGIAVYNAQVKAYESYLDAYKLKVSIYEAKVRGALATVEVYKVQIDAELAKAQVNTSLVNQYKVQVDAALSAIEVYKAQIAAIQTKADVEKTKVMVFGEQIKGYVAQINAFTAQVEAYRASLQAEGTKQDVFKTRVDSFKAQVDAAAQQSQARIAEYDGRIKAKLGEYDGLKSVVAAESARVEALAAGNRNLAEMYASTVQGTSAYNETLTKQWQVSLDQAQRVTDIGVNAAKANADLYLTTRSLALDAAKVGAQVEAQLGAAALSAINWSTSSTYSTGNSISHSSSKSDSTSDSNSLSRSYNYNF